MSTEKKVLWICPEEKGGIRTYTLAYQSYLEAALQSANFKLCSPFLRPLKKTYKELFSLIAKEKPDIVHVQHEYGIWGSKNPPFYFFPHFMKKARKRFPQIKFLATAHTVLTENARYAEYGNAAWLKWLLNKSVLPAIRNVWNEKTWSLLDGVIVHSKSQVATIEKAGCKVVREIPHFVPKIKSEEAFKTHPLLKDLEGKKKLVVFGYFSADKGQDVAVQAMTHLPQDFVLILAGGVRHKNDKPYYEGVKKLRKKLGLTDRVIITEYLEEDFIHGIYEETDLVIVPFRATSGSGSLAQALARKKPILASDLTLNKELNERVPGCLELFKSEDPEDLASVVMKTIANQEKMAQLRRTAEIYAEKYGIDKMAALHGRFYQEFLAGH